MSTKECSKCGRVLPVSSYYKNSASDDGLDYTCRDCRKACSRRYYRENRKVRCQRKIIKSHGVGLIYKNFLLASQGWKCSICGKELKPNSSDACLDHDHLTGDIRGVLCRYCNGYIGKFGDNIIGISKGIMADTSNQTLVNAYGYLL
jgi:hypothetical protein